MNIDSPQFDLMEANLQGLRARLPDVPASGILMCRLIQHIGRDMSTMFEHSIRPFGLAEAEFRVLATLYSQPEGVAHPSDLCLRASQSPANMSRISDVLVDRQLITRVLSVQDRRKMVLRITEQGEALVRDLLPKMWGPLNELLKDFSEHEQLQMIHQLKRLGLLLDREKARNAAEPGV